MEPLPLLRYLFWVYCILALLPGQLRAKVLEVGQARSFKTIHLAIEVAEDGDEVMIYGGHYAEGNIVINKSIQLTGIGWPVLDGKGETEILTITAPFVCIEGLEILHVGTSYLEDRAGIRVKGTHGAVIRNNRLINTFFGIYLEKSSRCEIYDNEILGDAEVEMSSGNAIHIWYGKEIEIRDNLVTGHRDGIYLEFVDNSIVDHNQSRNNLRYGLHFMFSDTNSYAHNHFTDNGAGVAVMFSSAIEMRHNRFENNWGRASYGLLLKEINDGLIESNTFIQNTTGIHVEGSNRIMYRHNDFVKNGWAVNMSGGCMDNTILANNFLGNTFDFSMNSRGSSNLIDGNYWSEYNGYDIDRDGVGDRPFSPVKMFGYVVNQTPESIVLLRSTFIDLLNYSEKISPVITPDDVKDYSPSMVQISPATILQASSP